MAKNISLLGADYPAVPAVQLPKTGGGTATFYDIESDTYNGTTNGYGFVISNVSTSRKLLSAYSDQGPVVYWEYNGVWVFALLTANDANLPVSKKANQAMTVYYHYFE